MAATEQVTGIQWYSPSNEKGDAGTRKADISALLNVMASNFYQVVNDMLKSMLLSWTVWKGETFTASGNNVTGLEFSMQSFVIEAWGMLKSMQWRELPAPLSVKKNKTLCKFITQEMVEERLKKGIKICNLLRRK